MSCSYGEKFKITIFGQSHSSAIGVVIDGIPAGIKLDEDRISAFMARRAPGKNKFSTPRKEKDMPEILAGVVDGVTCGAPLCAVIHNADQHSKDYENIRIRPRPAHADYAAFMKHHGFNDIRGGGNFSGRMTAPLCFAGAVAMQILEADGIYIGAHIQQIGSVKGDKFSPTQVCKADFNTVLGNEIPVLNSDNIAPMLAKMEEARMDSNSVGGIIECAVTGIKAGIGDPIFDGVENNISKIIFGIPAIKGIEFGNGFECASLFGSENNDEFEITDGEIKTKTNNHGGILGGITSGMPVIFRVAVKPTPSIGKEQNTVNLNTNENDKLVIEGRHDPCIVPRAVPCIEAAAAIAVINMI